MEDGGDRAPLHIRRCSLGCSGDRRRLTCTSSELAAGEAIRVAFNHPVVPASVNAFSASLVDVATGRAGLGTWSVEEGGRVLAFQPAVTPLPGGGVVYGLEPGSVYRLEIPGTAVQVTGPFVQTAGGRANVTQLDCTIAITSPR